MMARNLVGGFTPKALVHQALITFKLQPTTRPLTIFGRRSRGSDPGSKRSPPTKGQPGQHNGIDTRSTVEDKVGVGETNNAITNIHNTPNTTTVINASS